VQQGSLKQSQSLTHDWMTWRDETLRCPGSGWNEAEPHNATGVVGIEVHQDNGLPRAEGGSTSEYGNGHRGTDQRREHMVGTVPRRSVGMPVSVVTGQHPVERILQISFGSRARFHDGQTRGGVGHEDIHQSVGLTTAKSPQCIGDVNHLVLRGVDVNLNGLH